MYKIPADTFFMGKNLVFMPECHSTNTIASELSQMADSAEGTVVITDDQTAGRGQEGSLWLTAPGKNLTFSIILNPAFLIPKNQFLLNMVISLGVLDFLYAETKTADIKIKWPNDILVNEKKICGILIENQIQGNSLLTSIIGLGLNVNQTTFAEIRANSLQLLTGKVYDLNACFASLIQCTEVRYMMLKQGSDEKIREEYRRSMFGFNEKRSFKSGSSNFDGIIQGVNEYGCLIINSNEKQLTFNAKEVQFEM